MNFEDYKPIIVMTAVQFMYAGMALSVKAALLEGMSSRIFVVYRQCFGFLLIAPVAFFSRRGTNDCRLGWKSFWWIFLLSFVATQTGCFEGLSLVSSSVATAIGNLVPAITFIMAYAMGLEKVHLRSLRSIAKIIGTVVCVTGAAALAQWKGPNLLNTEFLPRNSLFLPSGGQDTWILGCLFLFGGYSCWSLSLILQVPVTARYPDHLSLTMWMCLMAALQSGILTLIIEPNTKPWKLSSFLQLFCCFFAGVVSAVTFFGQAWCIAKRGPLFSAMFQPLSTVIVTILACIFLHEQLYTGSLIGGVTVIVGLYVVLWGKAKDSEEAKEETTSYTQVSDNDRIDLEEPLLLNSIASFE